MKKYLMLKISKVSWIYTKKIENFQKVLLPKSLLHNINQHMSVEKFNSFWHFSFWKIVYSGRFVFLDNFFCSLKFYFADIFNIYENQTISSRVNIFWLAMECKGWFYGSHDMTTLKIGHNGQISHLQFMPQSKISHVIPSIIMFFFFWWANQLA